MIFNIIKHKKELLDNNNNCKKKITRKFRNDVSDVLFIDFVSEGVNGVLQEWYQSSN